MELPSKPSPSEEQKEIAGLIRSGAYFKESRHWYQALYIGPIAERTFFLIVAGLAVLVGMTGVAAVLSLLPITDRPAQLVRTDRLDDTAMKLVQLRPRTMPLNEAMLNFFLEHYISAREGYDAEHYPANYAFIRAHSDAPTFNAYAQIYGPTNPQSPAGMLGENGKRVVSVEGMSINDKVEPKLATIKFSTANVVGDTVTTTQWTATIGFYYSVFVVTTFTDPTTGELQTKTQEPEFQVVNYVLAPFVPAQAAQAH